MKALRWYAKKDLKYEDVPEPFPGPGQVKVKISLAGICGTDLREYDVGPNIISADKVPLIIGHEFSGKVIDVGKGIHDMKPGDRVTGLCYWACGECFFCKKGQYNLCLNKGLIGATSNGCMAEYLVAPRFSFQKLPDSVSDQIGALVEPLSVALHAVHRGSIQIGDIVGIVGDGPIGLCALLAAKAAGASEVYVVSKHRNRGSVALTLGANAVININDEEPIKIINNMTGGLGVDLSLDCVGNTSTPQLSIALTRMGGTTVMVGASYNSSLLNFRGVMSKEKNIVGSSVYFQEPAFVVALLADNRIDPRPLISSIVPLKDAVEKGFKQLIENKETNLKILLQVS
jgi:(R,R)-butanediol dehydrogenase/meso-butanediol dehydrogenase/diacetyl reductase